MMTRQGRIAMPNESVIGLTTKITNDFCFWAPPFHSPSERASSIATIFEPGTDRQHAHSGRLSNDINGYPNSRTEPASSSCFTYASENGTMRALISFIANRPARR